MIHPSAPQNQPTTRGGDDGSKVVKAVLLAVLGFGSGTCSMIVAAGQWQIDNATLRYAITNFTVIAAIGLIVSAIWIWRH
ncbi:hypothetical protein [Actinoplanes sp. NPDC049118]|uniref:hypothetical protein n=1 Tax=Actinoplanes sp. NPDC049118 TaxID=3155769 RepID=UPI00340CF31B